MTKRSKCYMLTTAGKASYWPPLAADPVDRWHKVYVGCAKDPAQRRRCHNGEVVGGAIPTAGR
jgi:hypothetical protein